MPDNINLDSLKGAQAPPALSNPFANPPVNLDALKNWGKEAPAPQANGKAWYEYDPSQVPKGPFDQVEAVGRGVLGSTAEAAGGLAELVPLQVARQIGGKIASFGEGQLEKAKALSPTGSLVGQGLSFLAPIGGQEALAARVGRPLAGALVGAVTGAATPTTSKTAEKGSYGDVLREKAVPAALGGALGGAGGLIPGLTKAFQGTRPLSYLSKVADDVGLQKLGGDIRGKLESNLNNWRILRQAAADQDYDAYFRAGAPLQGQIISDFANDLDQFALANAGKLPKNDLAFVNAVKSELAPRKVGNTLVDINIEGLDNLKKKLGAVEAGYRPEGLDAVSKDVAQTLRQTLESRIDSTVPNGLAKKAWSSYATNSAPINKYNSMLGKQIMEDLEGHRLPDVYKIVASEVPSKVFKNADTVQAFSEFAQNPAFVQDQAAKFAVNEIASAAKSGANKAAPAARKFLIDHEDWLKTMPELKAQLEDFAKVAETGQNLKRGTKYVGGLAAAGAGLEGVRELLHRFGF